MNLTLTGHLDLAKSKSRSINSITSSYHIGECSFTMLLLARA
jgi:hypothetical protein